MGYFFIPLQYLIFGGFIYLIGGKISVQPKEWRTRKCVIAKEYRAKATQQSKGNLKVKTVTKPKSIRRLETSYHTPSHDIYGSVERYQSLSLFLSCSSKVYLKPWCILFRLSFYPSNTHHQRTVFRLRTGHCRLNAHRHAKDKN